MGNRAPVTMRLSQGLDLRTDFTVSAAPYLVQARNVWIDKETSMRKRNGFRALSKNIVGGGALAKASSLLAYNNELLLADDTYLYSWSQAAQQWMRRDVAIPTVVKQVPAPFAPPAVATVQYVQAGGIDYYAYSDASHVYVATADSNTKALISPPAAIFTNGAGGGVPVLISFQLCAFRATAAVVIKYTGGGPSYCLQVQTVGPTGSVSSALLLTNNMGNTYTGNYGVAYDGAALIVAWQDTALANKPITVTELNEALQVAPTYTPQTINCGTTSVYAVAVACSINAPAKAWIYADGYALQYTNLTQLASLTYPTNGTYLSTNTPTAVLGVMSDDGTVADFIGSSGGGNTAGTAFAANTASAYAAAAVPYSVAVSGPFRYNGDTYSWVGYQNVLGQRQTPLSGAQTATASPQSVAMLYNWTKQRYVARLGYGTINYSAAVPSPVSQPTPGTFAFGMVRNVALTATAGTINSPVVTLAPVTSPFYATVRFATASELQSARLGKQQFLANGLPYSYDGAAVTEHGFTVAPEIINVQEIGYNIGALVAGTRQYIAVWEWTDAQGQLHQSAPSGAFTYTRSSSATYAPVLTFAPLQLTQKKGVNIAIYKTTASGTIYFRLGTASAQTIGSYINTTGGTVTAYCFTDTNDSDTDIGGSTVYTTGGELPNDAPPACTIVSAARTRLFLSGGEDDNLITYSKEVVASLGLGFSLALTQRVDLVPGAVTGVCNLDDKTIAFKQNNIVYWSGTGPTPNGANNDFTDIQILTNGVGCVSAPSMINTPDATLFQSVRGIYQLGRDLGVTFIGAPVSPLGTLAITSAVLVPAKGHVRFGSASADCLVYAYEALSTYPQFNITAGQWTTFGNYNQVGAAVWQGAYSFARANGQVCVETTGFDDAGSAIAFDVQTGWIRPAGPLEAGEFYEFAILGMWQGAHVLHVEEYVDYSTAPVGSVDFQCGPAVTGNTFGTGAWGTMTPWGGDSDISYALKGILPVSTPQIAALQLRLKDMAMSGQVLKDSVILGTLTVSASLDDGALLRAATKKFSGS